MLEGFNKDIRDYNKSNKAKIRMKERNSKRRKDNKKRLNSTLANSSKQLAKSHPRNSQYKIHLNQK